MSFRYIGSKARVAEELKGFIGHHRSGWFVDLFCGTGAVCEVAADLGWPIRLNDTLHSAAIVSAARLIAFDDAKFSSLGGYEQAIANLNELEPSQGFIWREYSPASKERVGIERRYFSEMNAGKIDSIRSAIWEWRDTDQIDVLEERLLIGDLLGAVNRVANIAGTYGCFLRKWTPQAHAELRLIPRTLKENKVPVDMCVGDASEVEVSADDLAYLDPPYTKRQYASYYHILETVTLGDQPVVEGVSGLRPWKELASDFCYKVRAKSALSDLLSDLPAKRVLLSYSNQGHLKRDEIEQVLSERGTVSTIELKSIGRYRPNQKASAASSAVQEFLFDLIPIANFEHAEHSA